jgi:hypothetical protein
VPWLRCLLLRGSGLLVIEVAVIIELLTVDAVTVRWSR